MVGHTSVAENPIKASPSDPEFFNSDDMAPILATY
jgi:hypothetical protein